MNDKTDKGKAMTPRQSKYQPIFDEIKQMDPNDKEWVLKIDCKSEAELNRTRSAIYQHFRNKDLDVNTCTFDDKETLYVVVDDDELCSDQSNLPADANLRKETRWEVPEFEYVSKEWVLQDVQGKSKIWQKLEDKIDIFM